MLRNLIASRGFVSILGAVMAAAVVAAGSLVMINPTKKQISYCALMTDSIGLYVGNSVTLRGVNVGSVRDIQPEGTGVRVEFRIDADHPLETNPSAVTVSDTVVADRRLAVNTEYGGQRWDPATCLTNTATPKSISQTLNALGDVADKLEGGDSGESGAIGAAVNSFDQSTKGLGTQLNSVVKTLANAIKSPDAGIANISSLIDSLDTLWQSVANGWGKLKVMLDGLSPILQLVNEVWTQVVNLINSIVVILPWFNDITVKYGGLIKGLLDKTVPFLHLVSANIGSLEKLIDMIPMLDSVFVDAVDPDTGLTVVTFAPPKLQLDPATGARVCDALNAREPGRCIDPNAPLTGADISVLTFGIFGGGR